jgi:hypothetical protein
MIGSSGDSIYFSAAQMEPEMHPMMQIGMSFAPYAALAGASYYAMKSPVSKHAQETIFDYAHSLIMERAARTPMGLGNTFRIPELMSFFTSPHYKGMDIGRSVIDESQMVGHYTLGSEFFENKDSLKHLKTTIGDAAYENLEMRMSTSNFRFRLEQGFDERFSGKLIFEQFVERGELLPDEKGVVDPKTSKMHTVQDVIDRFVVSDSILPLPVSGHPPEALDALRTERVELQTQPIFNAAIQNTDAGIDPNKVFIARADDIEGASPKLARFGYMSGTGPSNVGGIQGFKNRTAVPFAYLTFGASRFNKVVKSTFEQIPIAGQIIESGLKTIGLNPYTKPGPFYKQYMNLGLKASAIGAAYLGLRTIDHYRRNFGVAGHLVASAGVSVAGAALVRKSLNEAQGNLSRTLPTRVGAGLFALQMMPGFSQGIKEGVATTLVNADIARSYVGKYTGLSGYRRTLEGLFPGISDPTVGAGVGVALAGLSYGNFGAYLNRNNKRVLPETIRNRIGFFAKQGGSVQIPKSESEHIQRKIFDMFSPRTTMEDVPVRKGPYEIYNQFEELLTSQKYKEVFEKTTGNLSYGKMSIQGRKSLHNLMQESSPLIAEIYDMSLPEAKMLGRKLYMGARVEGRIDFHEEYVEKNPLHKSLEGRLDEIGERYERSGFVGKIFERIEKFGAKSYHAFFGASLAGEEYEEISMRHGGKPALRRAGGLFAAGFGLHQLLTTGVFGSMDDPDDLKATYKGEKLVEVKRGRFWEGGGTPYSGMETNYFRPHQYHAMMTRSNEKSVWGDEHDVYNPISKFVLKNFTYHLEDKNYYERPYPISSPALESLPVIGPLLGATIGSLIKPPKFMHEDEFMQVNESGEVEFAYREEYGSPSSLGGTPPGKPLTPNDLLHRLGQIQYQSREIEGITGYGKNVIQKMMTGRETLGTMMPVMESSGRMDSSILNYWDMETGGALFMSEGLRRLLPRPRAEIERYNPIMNSMPSWLPDRFRRGDPYRSVAMGHTRLPGKGYEAVYPELEGTPGEEYPLIHKYKIMSDVAPKSHRTMTMRQELMEKRAAKATTDYENKMMDQIFEMHKQRLSSIKDFDFQENAIKIPGLSNLTSKVYKTGETVVRKAVAPAEYLIPAGFRPAQKLLGDTRGITETYEFDQMYGTPHAFWDAPIRDWLRPSMYSAMNALGWQGKPLHVQRREEVNEHFDKLQFIKYTNLAKQAVNQNDKQRYLKLASKTRVGVNPQGDALGIYMSLPDSEKKYFDAFANAKASERNRILELMPEDQAHLYQSVWNRIDTGGQQSLYAGSQVQLNEQEMMSQSMDLQGEMELPAADWVGWHKDVDLEDIKLKYVSSLGEDIHDYGKFNSQLRRLDRRPYLNQSEDFVYLQGMPDSRGALERLRDREGIDFRNLNIYNQKDGQSSSAYLNYNYDRSTEVGLGILERLGE